MFLNLSDENLLGQQKKERFGFTSLLVLTPLLPLMLHRFLCQLVRLFPLLLVRYPVCCSSTSLSSFSPTYSCQSTKLFMQAVVAATS